MPLASHIQLPPRYRVARHIASGGMASVWEVEDLLLGRIVAVKVLAAQYALDPLARERFQREARTAARVSDHANIATIYDIGEHDDDAFIVMEHFAGGTVADRVRAARDSGQRVPRDTALGWLREAAAALDVAHAAEIVHRDVKPANLLLDAQDRLAVGDFGIARLADDTHMTQTGQVLGTAAYLSPEQAIGLPATPASDRYALAVVAYELLTGQRPFAGGPPSAQARQHAEIQPARASLVAPDLSAAVDAVFARGLAKDPALRPATASELVSVLERALRAPAGAGEPTEATRPLPLVTPAAPGQLARPPIPAAGAAASAHADAAAAVPPIRPVAPTAVAAPRRSPAAPAPPRRGGAPRGQSPQPRERYRTPIMLVALAAVIAGVALAVTLGTDDPADRQTAASAARTTQTSARSTPAAAQQQPAPATASETTGTTTTTTQPAGSDPAALNDQGFALNSDGRYAEAVAPLQTAVQAYRDAGRTAEKAFAYALFNLAVALNRSGNPAAAVPLLRERLRYDDQPGTVLKELRNALTQLGQKPGKQLGEKPGKSERGKGNDD